MRILRNKSEASTVALVTIVLALLMVSSTFIGFSSSTAATVDASGASASVNRAVEGIPPLESFWGA